MTLFPYQVEGARFLASHKRAMLLDEPGLGKTAQAIEACNLLGLRQVLVVCPASVRANWHREFKRFGSGQSLTVESFDKVARRPEDYAGPWEALIIDEAHYLKSPSAKRTVALYGNQHIRGIAEMAGHVFALTGTPAPNHAGEMWTHMAGLAPDTLAMAAYPDRRYDHDRFLRRYCKTIDTEYGIKVVGSKNLEDLRQRLATFTLRRRKADVLTDLPEIRYEELLIDAPAAARAFDSEIPDDEMQMIRDVLKDGDAANLQALTGHLSTLRRLTAMAKVEAVAEWVRDWLDQMPGRKIVIFGQHVAALQTLRDRLRSSQAEDPARRYPSYIDGSTRSDHRQRAVDEFQGNPKVRVFIGQIQAAGTGLTLTAASDLLFLEQSWVPAENAQAAQRIHRIGQKNGCLVRYCTLSGSVDEGVQRVLARKTKMVSDLLD